MVKEDTYTVIILCCKFWLDICVVVTLTRECQDKSSVGKEDEMLYPLVCMLYISEPSKTLSSSKSISGEYLLS